MRIKRTSFVRIADVVGINAGHAYEIKVYGYVDESWPAWCDSCTAWEWS